MFMNVVLWICHIELYTYIAYPSGTVLISSVCTSLHGSTDHDLPVHTKGLVVEGTLPAPHFIDILNRTVISF